MGLDSACFQSHICIGSTDLGTTLQVRAHFEALYGVQFFVTPLKTIGSFLPFQLPLKYGEDRAIGIQHLVLVISRSSHPGWPRSGHERQRHSTDNSGTGCRPWIGQRYIFRLDLVLKTYTNEKKLNNYFTGGTWLHSCHNEWGERDCGGWRCQWKWSGRIFRLGKQIAKRRKMGHKRKTQQRKRYFSVCMIWHNMVNSH